MFKSRMFKLWLSHPNSTITLVEMDGGNVVYSLVVVVFVYVFVPFTVIALLTA